MSEDESKKDVSQTSPEEPQPETASGPAGTGDVSDADAKEHREDSAARPASHGSSSEPHPSDDDNWFDNFQDNATGQLEHVFPGHGTEAFWACVGFVCALLILWIGFWRTLVIVLFVVAGIAFGQYLEGDPKILNAIKSWFDNNQRKS